MKAFLLFETNFTKPDEVVLLMTEGVIFQKGGSCAAY